MKKSFTILVFLIIVGFVSLFLMGCVDDPVGDEKIQDYAFSYDEENESMNYSFTVMAPRACDTYEVKETTFVDGKVIFELALIEPDMMCATVMTPVKVEGSLAVEQKPRDVEVTINDQKVFRIEIHAVDYTLPKKIECSAELINAEMCTEEYAPVCGDDGVTYSNACYACSSGNITHYTLGECEDKEKETILYEMVKDHSVKIDSSKGELVYSITLFARDACTDFEVGDYLIQEKYPPIVHLNLEEKRTDDDVCAQVLTPRTVEGTIKIDATQVDSFNVSVGGEKVFSITGREILETSKYDEEVSKFVECPKEFLEAETCTMEYAPVCGDDGVTYGNACVACSSGKITHYAVGECRTPDLNHDIEVKVDEIVQDYSLNYIEEKNVLEYSMTLLARNSAINFEEDGVITQTIYPPIVNLSLKEVRLGEVGAEVITPRKIEGTIDTEAIGTLIISLDGKTILSVPGEKIPGNPYQFETTEK